MTADHDYCTHKTMRIAALRVVQAALVFDDYSELEITLREIADERCPDCSRFLLTQALVWIAVKALRAWEANDPRRPDVSAFVAVQLDQLLAPSD